MHVYISVDIEGMAGIVDPNQITQVGGAEYELGRRLMTNETNAAVEGAIAAGATKVMVNDSHATMRNRLPDLLHARATLVQGRLKHWFMAEGAGCIV